jgi:hypothetical protein
VVYDSWDREIVSWQMTPDPAEFIRRGWSEEVAKAYCDFKRTVRPSRIEPLMPVGKPDPLLPQLSYLGIAQLDIARVLYDQLKAAVLADRIAEPGLLEILTAFSKWLLWEACDKNLATRASATIAPPPVEQKPASPDRKLLAGAPLADRVRFLVKWLELNDRESIQQVRALLHNYPDSLLKASP